MFESIPADRRDTARAALSSAFGRAPLTYLKPITSGATAALIYRIEVGGRPYLLRLEALPGEVAVGDGDVPRAYLCMRTAAEAGIAPALHHADPVAGSAIMDFHAERPIADYPGGPAARARALGSLAARLQATPAFAARDGQLIVLGRLLDRLCASRLFAPGLLDRHREGFERIRDAYPWDEAALVSSHNDLHPANILFDGRRLWLIDWETAHRNDPLVDLGIMANYLAATPELEEVLLHAWLGRAPDRALRARMVLMRQLGRLFYACVSSLHAATAPPPTPSTDLAALSVAEFLAAVEQGRLVPGTTEFQRVGGRVALRTFLAGLSAPGFEQALVIARQG